MTDTPEVKVNVDDSLYGMAEVSRGFLILERRRTRFLAGSIVVALMMNVGWLIIGVLRDRARSEAITALSEAQRDLTHQNERLTDQIKVLTDSQATLSDSVQNAIDQKIVLDELKRLLSETQRSLDCVALYVSGQPSRSKNCTDVNERLRNLQRGRTPFPLPTATTRPPPTTTTTRPPPTTTTLPPTTTPSTAPPCRGIYLLGLCIGG